MSVIDASAAFECARVGHEPLMKLQPNIFVASWVCECARCGRFVQFDMPKPKPLSRAADGHTQR